MRNKLRRQDSLGIMRNQWMTGCVIESSRWTLLPCKRNMRLPLFILLRVKWKWSRTWKRQPYRSSDIAYSISFCFLRFKMFCEQSFPWNLSRLFSSQPFRFLNWPKVFRTSHVGLIQTKTYYLFSGQFYRLDFSNCLPWGHFHEKLIDKLSCFNASNVTISVWASSALALRLFEGARMIDLLKGRFRTILLSFHGLLSRSFWDLMNMPKSFYCFSWTMLICLICRPNLNLQT